MLDEETSDTVRSGPGQPQFEPYSNYLNGDASGFPEQEMEEFSDQVGASDVTDDQITQLRNACESQPEAERVQGWIPNRFRVCIQRNYHLQLTTENGGPVLGDLIFDMWLLGFAENGSRRVEYIASVENILVAPRGSEDPNLWRIRQSFTPANSTPELSVPAITERDALLASWEYAPDWRLVYTAPVEGPRWSNGDFQIVTATVTMSMGVTSPSARTGWSEVASGNSNVRFDFAGPTVGRHQGTVFTDAAPETFSLEMSDPQVWESAQHIQDAQESPEMTFPSWLGKSVPGQETPLHRLIDRPRQDENRDIAVATCDDIWGEYDGSLLNCDEYPFSSTYEGAATGDDRYSARLIDADDNQEAGRRLGRFYREHRILDGDAFYVEILP
ncbi:NucA/NucB deoxyribonuclease domain-containing protein [Nocardiopsis sp. NPDC049922]|uniref:NucA/NucB deoxyribonuclease domain-containing protein n=1 Tax=Nocardiopsis sp. NPDC049922 TaxID=3155157 RepID=UPI0033F9E499